MLGLVLVSGQDWLTCVFSFHVGGRQKAGLAGGTRAFPGRPLPSDAAPWSQALRLRLISGLGFRTPSVLQRFLLAPEREREGSVNLGAMEPSHRGQCGRVHLGGGEPSQTAFVLPCGPPAAVPGLLLQASVCVCLFLVLEGNNSTFSRQNQPVKEAKKAELGCSPGSLGC